MSIFSLYQYKNRINGKSYIGVTCDPDKRFVLHERGESGAVAFNRAMKKHGSRNFIRKILAIFDNASAAAYHEQAAILKFETLAPDGYNLTAGAPFTQYGGPWSEEASLKRSESQKGHAPRPAGFHHSEETKAKMRASAKLIEHSVGWHHSDEARANMSRAQKGHPISEETKAKISASEHATKSKGK
jgi:group I intron endonuclease